MSEEVKYENIGNVRRDYNHTPRRVLPIGLITDPSLVLKMYAMIEEESAFMQQNVDEAKEFLQDKVKSKEIEPLTGLGFAILSKDMLNVARWDTEYPILLKNLIYGYEETTPQEHKKALQEGKRLKNYFENTELLDLNKVGPFCVWELGIVTHEKNAWMKYLVSLGNEEDKETYLKDVIKGTLPIIGGDIS